MYLRKDIKHFLVNAGALLVLLLFYQKYGFLGWPHLLFVICIQYAVLPLDDWLEGARPFPYYILPLVAYAAFYNPLLTALALVGDVVVNLRAMLHNNSFILERLEGLGNLPIYIMPIAVPFGLGSPTLYLAASLFILFADSFHKIGHQETPNPTLMWGTGVAALLLLAGLFATPTVIFASFLAVILASLVPFYLLKSKLYRWGYSQAWFTVVGFMAFYYYLHFVV